MLVCVYAPACSALSWTSLLPGSHPAWQHVAAWCCIPGSHKSPSWSSVLQNVLGTVFCDLGKDHLEGQMLLCCRWCGSTPPMATGCPRCQPRTGTTTETWLGRHAQMSSPSTWCSLRGPASRWAGVIARLADVPNVSVAGQIQSADDGPSVCCGWAWAVVFAQPAQS